MTNQQAVDRVMSSLGLGNKLREFVTRRVSYLTDGSEKIDRYTVDALRDVIRRELR